MYYNTTVESLDARPKGLYHAMAIATCWGCDEDIRFPGRPRLGQTVTCYRCGARLEIVDANPLELDWSFQGDDTDEDELENALGFEDEMADYLRENEQEEL